MTTRLSIPGTCKVGGAKTGGVKTGLRNFTTTAMKKGAGNNGLFGKNLYALDPFERAEDLARDERMKHHEKIPARFTTTIHPKPTFDNP